MANQITLFSNEDLHSVLRYRTARMRQDINEYAADLVLNTPVEDLAQYFTVMHRVDAPKIREEEIVVDSREVLVDVSGQWGYDPFARGSARARGMELTIEIPFDGEQGLFLLQPSTRSSRRPHGRFEAGVLVFSLQAANLDADEIRRRLDGEIQLIHDYLDWVQQDVATHNAQLFAVARSEIEERRARLLRDRGVAAQLGYRLKERADAPRTYAPPQVQRRVQPKPPVASMEPFVPEPALPDPEYENILRIIGSMATVLERSPRAFRSMGEEELRDHFLVQLNGQYEGDATGETFNFEGKSDILIRVNGRNIFIGECKIWGGPRLLIQTVDQLLGYATWRDTKTAIVIFNRNKDFSAVLAKIPETLRGHPQVKRELDYPSETGFRYVLKHRDDPSRELLLTVLAFEVPR